MFTNMFAQGNMLYYVVLGYAFQKGCKFTTVEFSPGDMWPMPVDPDASTHQDALKFPFEKIGTDGLEMMKKFLTSVGAPGFAGQTVFRSIIPFGAEISQAARNQDILRTRLHFVDARKVPVGCQTILLQKLIVDNLELKYFNKANGMLGELCDEAFFGATKMDLSHNIWAEHTGQYYYGLEIETSSHSGECVTAKKLCGDIDQKTNMWRSRTYPTVQVGYKGFLPEQFGWYMDNFVLVAGIGMTMQGSSSGVLYPLYIQMLGPRC